MREPTRAEGPPTVVYAACAVTFALGLVFIFVWTPLPWGWHGIDFYYENALALARGETFGTTKIMWGYAYFLAPWYYMFGDRPWIPLTAQAAVNASIPLMVYYLARHEIGERVAVVAAAISAVLSFNTVYASTQASDAMCTAIFTALMLCWCVALHPDDHSKRESVAASPAALFAASGVLAGIAYQFRPNLILFPVVVAAVSLAVLPRNRTTVAHVGLFLALVVGAGLPWVVHVYRSTGLLVPASTHGGRQLWFGTLQTGPYFDNWLANPRSVLENPFLDYTSLDDLPLVVSGRVQPGAMRIVKSVELRYWTSRNPEVRRVPVTPAPSGLFELSIPPQPAPVALSYYFVVRAVRDGRSIEMATPERGAEDPKILVVSRDHLGDLDVASQTLDVFDIVRLMRHLAWRDPLLASDRLGVNHDGADDEGHLRRAATQLADLSGHATDSMVGAFEHDSKSATMRFVDGSTLEIPREWSGRISDVVVRGESASRVVTRSRTFASLRVEAEPPAKVVADNSGLLLEDVGINRVLRRYEPQEMRRAIALALDNIRREPAAFLIASLKRALRLFVVEGGFDRQTTVQFKNSAIVYTAARTVSIAYFGLFVGGIVLAIQRGHRLLVLLAPIVYVPVTICPMLVTSRYATTVQPLVFVFMAVTLVEAGRFIRRLQAAGTETVTGSPQ